MRLVGEEETWVECRCCSQGPTRTPSAVSSQDGWANFIDRAQPGCAMKSPEYIATQDGSSELNYQCRCFKGGGKFTSWQSWWLSQSVQSALQCAIYLWFHILAFFWREPRRNREQYLKFTLTDYIQILTEDFWLNRNGRNHRAPIGGLNS